MKYELLMTANEVMEYVWDVFPQAGQFGFSVSDLKPGEISILMSVNQSHLRPGGTVSGPAMFTLADCAAYLLILTHIGKVALAVTTNLNINFLAKPAGDLVAHCKLLKLGKRLAVCEISIFSHDTDILVSHATATYSIPPQ